MPCSNFCNRWPSRWKEHWSRSNAESPAATRFFEQVEEFIVTRVVNFLAVVFPSFQNLGYFVLVGLLLMLLAVTSYPFQPRNEFLFFNWVVILSFMGTIFWIFVQMDRDTVLSLLTEASLARSISAVSWCCGAFSISARRSWLCSARSFLRPWARFSRCLPPLKAAGSARDTRCTHE